MATIVMQYPMFVVDVFVKQENDLHTVFKDWFISALLEKDGIDNIDYNHFTNTVYQLTNDDKHKLKDTLFKIMNNVTYRFCDNLNNLIKRDELTIERFIQLKDDLVNRLQHIITLMAYYDNLIDSYRFDVRNIFNMQFYKNIIAAEKYNLNNKKVNLYTYLGHLICKIKSDNIEDYTPLIELHNMFKICVQIRKDHKNIPNCCKDLYKNIGSDDIFVKRLAININRSILKIYNGGASDDLKTFIIVALIAMSLTDNRTLFNRYYEKYLEERLLSIPIFPKDIASQERSLLDTFKKPEDNLFAQTMIYKIDDVLESGRHKMIYDKLQINPKSDKYKDFDMSKFDRSKVDIKTLRYSAWAKSKQTEFTEYTLPPELEPYIDVFSAYYSKRYPNQDLQFNFNNGTGVVKIHIKQKFYNLKLTTPQMILLFQFNKLKKKKGFTAKELADMMGISLATLTPIINSFLVSNLIIRDSGPSNDFNIRFYINKNFKSDKSEISLIDTTEAYVQKMAIMDNTILLRCAVVKLLKNHKVLSIKGLAERVFEKVPFPKNEDMLKEVLANLVKEKYLKIQHNVYKYIEKN